MPYVPGVGELPYTPEGEERAEKIKARLWDEMVGSGEGPAIPTVDRQDRENLRAAMARVDSPEFKLNLAYKLADLDNERGLALAEKRAESDRETASRWKKYAPGGYYYGKHETAPGLGLADDFMAQWMDRGRPEWTRSEKIMGVNKAYGESVPWGAPLGPREQEEAIQARRHERILQMMEENERALRAAEEGRSVSRWDAPEWMERVYGHTGESPDQRVGPAK